VRFKYAIVVKKHKTTWVDCAYWTDRTGIAPYLKKGTSVYVEGTPDVRTYTTADGRNGATLSLRTLNIQLLGGRPNEGGSAQPDSSSTTTMVSSQPQDSLDDLPF
jgi:single-strand DNA-binding protein